MACGFLLFAIFNFIIQYIIGGIYSLILIYFLYIGWARFDACSILLVFVFSLVQTVQYLIIIISMYFLIYVGSNIRTSFQEAWAHSSESSSFSRTFSTLAAFS